MKTTDFSTTLMVGQTPEQAFTAINNVSGWWSEELDGNTDMLNSIFTVRFGEVYIKSKVVELVPSEKIVWEVIDCNKPWLKNTKEWNGTKMSWDISAKNGKTQVHFIHLGLVPEFECFEVCSNAWGEYLEGSLMKLINSGQGNPTALKGK